MVLGTWFDDLSLIPGACMVECEKTVCYTHNECNDICKYKEMIELICRADFLKTFLTMLSISQEFAEHFSR